MKPYAIDVRSAIADAEHDCNPQGSYDPVELQHARVARASLAIAERLERIAELLESQTNNIETIAERLDGFSDQGIGIWTRSCETGL